MELLTIAFLFLLSGYSSGKLYTVEDCGTSLVSESRIVNGTVTTRGKYPWMVSIHDRVGENMRQACGGAILNENWIITAAHCFDQPINLTDYEVYAGLYSLLKKNESTVQKLELSDIIIHDEYDEDGFAKDIALIKTAIPIDIEGSEGYVNGICFPEGDTDPSGEATVIGWGKLKSDDNKISAELREVTLPLVSREKCNETYTHPDFEFEYIEVVSSMLCAGGQGKDTCQYDSGGPLFQYDENGVATLIGTVANGAECAYKNYPGLYMKVSAFRSWIDKVMT